VKIQIDTDGDKPHITLLECNWGVQPMDDGQGTKLIVFGDERFDLIVPMGDEAAKRMATKLLLTPASSLVSPNGDNVHDLMSQERQEPRNGR
jgi:hypothetical protein